MTTVEAPENPESSLAISINAGLVVTTRDQNTMIDVNRDVAIALSQLIEALHKSCKTIKPMSFTVTLNELSGEESSRFTINELIEDTENETEYDDEECEED